MTGAWVFGPGTAVIGGTANDMVIGGVVHFGTPLPTSNLDLKLEPYFPTVPFPSDLPYHVFAAESALQRPVGIGSSYHNSPSGPQRTYMRADAGTFFDNFTGTISVLYTGSGNYVILSALGILRCPK